jgi:hypothetical protein
MASKTSKKLCSKPKQTSGRGRLAYSHWKIQDYEIHIRRRPRCKNTELNSRLTMSRGRKLATHADRNQYAISAPDRPTHYLHRMNVRHDVLDIFLHPTGLPIFDSEILNELNSDHIPVLLTVDSSTTSHVLRGSGHFVKWDEFRRYLR